MPVIAFHGEPGLKAAVMDRLREHRRLDEIVQGRYWQDNRGCHLGCLTHVDSSSHEAAERLFGIERRVGYWLESVFEHLPEAEAADWVIESTEAIPVGADLSLSHHVFGAWLHSGAIFEATEINLRVAALHRRAAAGEHVPEQERSAWSAAVAAWSASAWSASAASAAAAAAAESWSAGAAWSESVAAAEAAAAGAASAAASASAAAAAAAAGAAETAGAASAAAWKKIATKSIEIFRTAPVAHCTLRDDVRAELCARRLWCPDDPAVEAISAPAPAIS